MRTRQGRLGCATARRDATREVPTLAGPAGRGVLQDATGRHRPAWNAGTDGSPRPCFARNRPVACSHAKYAGAISINLGVLIPDHDILRGVRDLCRQYGTLFIADEVACGFGRTGRVFACEHFDLDPYLLCVAKAMSGGLAPIGAVLATAPVARSMEDDDGSFYSTYGWHPRSVAAAIATLRHLKANRARLLAGVAEMSEYFRVRLLQLPFERPATVRIQGLAIGIDVGDEDYADAIQDKCRRDGLLMTTEGTTVLLLPSLAIDKRTAAKGLDILAGAI